MTAVATSNTAVQNGTPPAKPVGKVTNMILVEAQKMQTQGRLTLPKDYDLGNALSSAWLKLQTVQNSQQKNIIRDGQIDESVVTKVSVTNALLDYVIQGLSVAKNQAYFIVYGTALTCQRSYHGDMLVAQRVKPGIVFFYDSIRENEKVVVKKKFSAGHGLVSNIEEHETPFPRSANIAGAYAAAVDTATGEVIGSTIFDLERIKRSWAKSKMYNPAQPNTNGTHAQFPEEMALRTVIRHLCKGIINSSDDSELAQSIRRQDMESTEAEVVEDAAQNANKESLQLREPERVVNIDTGEIVDEVPNEAGF